MIIYHGSNVSVKSPKQLHQTRKLDFGAGFYTTTNMDQAKSFAHKVMIRTDTSTQFVSKYNFDLDRAEKELAILRFTHADEKWLDFVYRHRRGGPEHESYDIIYGPVANDDIFKTFILYESGIYTKEQTLEALKIKKLFDQMCFASDKALAHLKFDGVIDLTGGA